MNILMVVDDFFPDVISGSGRVVNEISKRLVNRSHSVYVLTRLKENEKLPLREDIQGVKVYRYIVNPRDPITFCISTLVNSYNIFKEITKNISFDLINYHQPLSAIGMSLSGKIKNIPKVYTFYSLWHKEYEIKTGKTGIGSIIRRWIERKILISCKKVIVLSAYSKSQVLDFHHFSASNIEVMAAGVDTERFKPSIDKRTSKAKLNIPPDKFFIFTVRRLVPRMGLENLIEAMSIIVKEKQNIILFIGGKGFLEEKLKELVKELGLDDYIKFLGLIEEDKLPSFYEAADLFILPSKYLEGFGLVTLEALSCGTPVLGTPVGGTKEILEQLDKDLLFDDINAKSIAEKILFYLTSKDLLILSKKGRDFVTSNYLWDRMVIKCERVYLEILSKERGMCLK